MIGRLFDLADRSAAWMATVTVAFTLGFVAIVFGLVFVGVLIAYLLPVWVTVPVLIGGGIATAWLFAYLVAREG